MSNPTSPVPLQVPKRRPRRGCSGRHLLRAYLRVTYVTPEVSAYCAPRLRSNSLPLDETTLPVGLASRPEVEVVRRCASVTSVDRREVVAGTLLRGFLALPSGSRQGFLGLHFLSILLTLLLLG